MKSRIFFIFIVFVALFLSVISWKKKEVIPILDGSAETTINQIPKVIHYVWFGSKELPPKAQECVDSWKKFHPDFKIKRWDEKKCDIMANPFVWGAYKRKRYDFASDYCRVRALEEGGIYMDTDMMLKAPFDSLLDEPLVLTLQSKNDISASFMAVVPHHPFVEALRNNYENRSNFDDFMLYNAPSTWGVVFWEVFRHSFSVGREKGQYRIVAPNILMYDFKGGEAVAEHFFGAGSKDVHRSAYYNLFRKMYLNQYAFYVSSEGKYFIFKNETRGYFFNLKERKAGETFRYTFNDGVLKIYEQDKLREFLCSNQKCQDKI